MKTKLLKSLRTILMMMLFVGCFLVSLRITFPVFEECFTPRNFQQIPERFPMVVFVNQKAEVIEYGQLAEYSKDHFDYSLTESQSQLVKLREQFEQENQANDSPAHFSFKVHPNGKIVLRVHGHSDGDLVDRSEYEVDGAQIVAKSHTLYFGPITSLPLLPVTWGLAFMFYKAIKMAFRHWQKTRIKMAPNNAEFQLPL